MAWMLRELEIEMSEELRERFEAAQEMGIKFNADTSEYENIFVQHRWEGFQACAKIKDVDIAKLKEQLENEVIATDYFLDKMLKCKVEIKHFKKQGADRLIGLCKCGLEREQLNAKVAMLMDTLKRASISLGAFCSDEGWSQADMDTLDSVDAALCSDKNSYFVTKWVNGVKAARDAEWMAEPVAECFMATTSDDEGRFYPILVARLMDGYPEELDGKKTKLFAKPKEVK